MSKRPVQLVLLCFILLFASGCWDQVQIEERGFVVGVAIDVPRSKQAERQAEQEAPDKPEGKQRFLVTAQFVIPGGLTGGGNSQGGGGQGSTTGEAYLNLTSEGDSIFEIGRELATRSSRSPFMEHLKVIIVSEKLAKSPAFADALEFFLRSPALRRSTKVLVAKGDAKDVIEVSPKHEKLPAMYINSVAENIQKNARMLPETRIGEVHEYLLKESSFVIPRVTPDKNEVKIAGAAVFRFDNIMAGFLGEEETEGLNFLTNNIEGGLLKIPVRDNLVSFNIESASRKIEANTSDKEHMRFVITIECEGAIAESFEQVDYLESKNNDILQQKVAEEIERITNDTIRKVHKQMKTDVIGLGSYLKQERNDLWKQIKGDWEQGENYYAKSSIEVKARVFIRNFGDIIEVEREVRK